MVVGDETTSEGVAADFAELADAIADGLEVLSFDRAPLLGVGGRTMVAEADDATVPVVAAERTLFAYARPNGVEAALLVRRVGDDLELREFEGRTPGGLFGPMPTRTRLARGGRLSGRRLVDPLGAERAVVAASLGEDVARRRNRAERAGILTRDADMLVGFLGILTAPGVTIVEAGPGHRRVVRSHPGGTLSQGTAT